MCSTLLPVISYDILVLLSMSVLIALPSLCEVALRTIIGIYLPLINVITFL